MKFCVMLTTFVAVFFAVGFGSVVGAQTIAGSVVVPASGWSSGLGYNIPIFENVGRRQQVYSTAGFPASGQIIKMAFRRPAPNFTAGGLNATLRVTLSTTLSAPNGLSPIFDLNTGSDATVVFDGNFTPPSLSGGMGCSSLGDEFVYAISFTQPFLFNGGGNLLVEFQVFVGSGTSGFVGYQSYAQSPSEASSIVSVASSPTAFAGLPVDAAYVTLFQFVNTPASVAVYGSGCPQSSGMVPQISSYGPPRVGSLCGQFSLQLTNAIPQTVAVLFLSLAPASIPINSLPGCTILVDPALLYGMYFLPTSASVNGEAQQSFAIPNDENLIGVSAYFQWAVIDGGIGLPLPFALTAGLQATIGI